MRLRITILSLLTFLLLSCSRTDRAGDMFTTVRLSISNDLVLDTKSAIVDSESAVGEIVFVAYSIDDGKCLWAGKGDGAEFRCQMGGSLRIVALCNYHDLLDMPISGESMEILDNETLEWDDVLLFMALKKLIPMYGEIEFTPSANRESVSIAVSRICNKIYITGTVSASGDVRAEGVDFDGPDRLSVLLSHSPSIIYLNGIPVPDCELLPDIQVSADLCDDLFATGHSGAYFPAGEDNVLVLQFEHDNRTWHYPVPLDGEGANLEYNINGITLGHFVDWDDEWSRNDVGIKISEWKQNHSIHETI